MIGGRKRRGERKDAYEFAQLIVKVVANSHHLKYRRCDPLRSAPITVFWFGYVLRLYIID